MRRARLRTSVNLASAKNRKRPQGTATSSETQQTKVEGATPSDNKLQEKNPTSDEGDVRDNTHAVTNPKVEDISKATEKTTDYVASDRGSDSQRPVVSTSKDFNNAMSEITETDNKKCEVPKVVRQIKEGNDETTANSVSAFKQEDTVTKTEASVKEKSTSAGGGGTPSGIMKPPR